jgi:hypothetical protein
MGRSVVFAGSLFMLAVLLFLTVYVAMSGGFTIIVGLAILIICVLGFGAIAALTGPPDD